MLINGTPANTLPALDRGLQFGDGLFETIAVRDSEPLVLERHLERLAQGAERLRLDPGVSRETLSREVRQVCAGISRGVAKVTVTRGSGGRGYSPPERAAATRLVSAHPWPGQQVLANQQSGVATGVSPVRLGRQPMLAGIKHLNRLEQVLARIHLEPSWQETLMLDENEHVIEASAANLFAVYPDRVQTPPVDQCGVAGVVRAMLLDQPPVERPVVIEPLALTQLCEAEEIFLTNSIIGIWPVTQVDTRRYAVGSLTRSLQAYLHDNDLAIFD